MVPVPGATTHVTAVLVSHDGARWLPQALAAISAQTRRPDLIVAVDTGSTDASVELLTAALGADAVVRADRSTGFGAAVGLGLAELTRRGAPTPDDGWVWLLHDDCAPEPGALAALLDAAEAAPGTGMVGPKVREWPSLRRLVEVGVSISGTGRRETGLERGEPDQGQHDQPRQVLAVGTAAALVRRRTWDTLGGLEPRLPLFGDDLDFGWRLARAGEQVVVAPSAVVFHAEAASLGLRTPGAVTGSPRREQRRAALFVLLANCRTAALPVQYVRLLVGSMLRTIGLLLLKAPREAADELGAAISVLGRPWRLAVARRRRRATARVPAAAVRPLLPPVLQPYRDGVAAVSEVVGGLVAPGAAAIPRSLAEPGPVADEAAALPAEPGPLTWVRARPWASTLLVLAVCALLAARGLLTGGELQGGALLPAPDSSRDWWAAYTAGWHPVGTGSTEPSPPYVMLLAIAGLATLGDAGLLISVLLLGAPVLAAIAAHVFLRRAGAGKVAALWAAVAYGVLPLVTGSVSEGRLGTVLGTILLPVLGATVLSLARDAYGPGLAPLERWLRRSRAGLAAAALVAFVPVAWPLLLVTALGLTLSVALRRGVRRRTGRTALSAVVVLAVPWVLGPSWLAARITDPALWWWEAGLPDAGTGGVDPGPVELALGMPGSGGAPAWLGAGVLLAAALSLVRGDRRAGVLAAWSVAALGLLVAAVGVAGDPADQPGAVLTRWVGFPLVVWWGGLLTAAAVGSHDLRSLLTGRSFGWLQPAVVLTVTAAVLGPLLALGWQVAEGIGAPLYRGAAEPVPAYMAADARTGTHPSTVVLVGDRREVAVTVVREDGWRTGEEPMRAAAAPGEVTRALAGLLAAPTGDDLATVSAFGIGYLYVPGPVEPGLAAALDSAPGLVRAGAPDGDLAWRLDRPTGTVRLGSRALALSTERDDGGPPWSVALPVAPGGAGQPLTVAAEPDPAWAATLEGQSLPDARSAGNGGPQTFAPPANAGDLRVEHDDQRGWLVALQMVGLAALLVLAAPTRRAWS